MDIRVGLLRCGGFQLLDFAVVDSFESGCRHAITFRSVGDARGLLSQDLVAGQLDSKCSLDVGYRTLQWVVICSDQPTCRDCSTHDASGLYGHLCYATGATQAPRAGLHVGVILLLITSR